MKPAFSTSLFWDVKIENINFDKHARFVIARVLTRGNLKDWKQLQAYYGLDKIKQEVINIRYLDKRTLSFCHHILGIPKESFKCYNTEASIRKLWNY